MAILAQQHDTETLLEAITIARQSVDHAIQAGRYDLAREYCDAGLADCSTYELCRNEGLDEPYCATQTADSLVGEARAYFETMLTVSELDFAT